MTTTDTPRTDAFIASNVLLTYNRDKYELTIVHARQLERELAEYIDENIKLWKIADCQEELERELSASKAEVERLNKLTKDCLNVIRVYCPTFYNDAMERFNKEIK